MYYESAQTVGPGWCSSYKPSRYEDMSWSPSSRHFRSPGHSPETYRRIIRTEEDFPTRSKEDDDDFFSGRRSPTFPRRVFKENWTESPNGSNHRFTERPRMFKRVFKPSQWEDEFEKDVPHLRRVEREFDRNFDNPRPTSRMFDEDIDRRFGGGSGARDLQKDIEDEFEKSEGRVHHIPILVEKRMEEMKSRFGRRSPSPERSQDGENSDEWAGPQVQRLRKAFEPEEGYSSRHGHHRAPRVDTTPKSRVFNNPIPETWDPHAIHTLPTRKVHKASQSFDDSRHPAPPKYVFRSYSETHEDLPKSQQPHSAAFRSHSDGHCPNQTYVTKIDINLPTPKDQRERGRRARDPQSDDVPDSYDKQPKPEVREDTNNQTREETVPKRKPSKHNNPSLQQIAIVLQNMEDLTIRVDSYNGIGRDKQYRFLDEMLTRCMLRLDDVDTEGREDIRSARKAAVREVQNCIDKLEAKAEESERLQMSKAIPLPDAKPEESGELKISKAIPLPDAPKSCNCDVQGVPKTEMDSKPNAQNENSTPDGGVCENDEQTKL